MPIKNYKPTSPSRRHLSVTDYSSLTDTRRTKRLTERIKRSAGRNNTGRITMRHQGGGNKNLYRVVDFKQDKVGVPGRVESIEYDPYRTAFIALVVYKDGDRRYILAPHGLKVGSPIINSPEAPLQVGSRTSLKRIPVGSFVHNIEIFPQGGAKIGRSAGVAIQVLANEEGHTHLKMPSGEVRKVFWDCLATIGQVSNPENNLVVYEDPTTLLSNGTFLLVICKLDQNGNVNSIDVGAKPKWGIAFKKPLNHFKNQLAGLLTINDFKISV